MKQLTRSLAGRGYWVARAAEAFADGQYSKTIAICREHLTDHPDLVSARVLHARALFHAGQTEAARSELRQALNREPDNLVALKYLGDTYFDGGREVEAAALYERIWCLDPRTSGLRSSLPRTVEPSMRTVQLKRAGESVLTPAISKSSRPIPFYTETLGDLYLSQGHPRLAAEVFQALSRSHDNPRLAEKLNRARSIIKERENQHVPATDSSD